MTVTSAVVITTEGAPDRLAAFHAAWDQAATGLHLDVYCSQLDDDPARGCWQAHHAVLAGASGPVLVLEDDAVFGPAFTPDVDLPADWDLVYFGGRYHSEDRPVHPVQRVDTTHAYAARDPKAVARQVGPYVPGYSYSPHLGQRLHLRRYAVDPPTVGQRGGVTSLLTGKVRPADDFFLTGGSP